MGDDAVRKVFEEQLAVVGEGLLADPSNQELLQLREEIKAGLAALARGPIDENYDPLSPLSGSDQSRSGESDDGQRDDHPSEDDANELNEEELWNKQQAPSEAVVITSIVFTDPHLLEEEEEDVEYGFPELRNANREKFLQWEKFTRGIGSKLLMRMGYEEGTGLGIRRDGIVEPVGIDKAQFHTRGLGFEKKQKRRRKSSDGGGGGGSLSAKKSKSSDAAQSNSNVFSFMNTSLNRPKSAEELQQAQQLESQKMRSMKHEELISTRSEKLEKQIALERSLEKLTQSYERNKKDPQLQAMIQAKINATKSQLQQVAGSQQQLEASIRQQGDKKKAFKF